MQLHTSKHLFERASSNTPPPFRMRSCRTIHLRALRCGPGDTDAAPFTARCPCQPPQRTANRLLLLKIDQFVTAITAKARHSVYMCRLPRNGGDPLKIILSVVAALVVTVGALTITGAGDDKSGTP